jgi:hypothetical protein
MMQGFGSVGHTCTISLATCITQTIIAHRRKKGRKGEGEKGRKGMSVPCRIYVLPAVIFLLRRSSVMPAEYLPLAAERYQTVGIKSRLCLRLIHPFSLSPFLPFFLYCSV